MTQWLRGVMNTYMSYTSSQPQKPESDLIEYTSTNIDGVISQLKQRFLNTPTQEGCIKAILFTKGGNLRVRTISYQEITTFKESQQLFQVIQLAQQKLSQLLSGHQTDLLAFINRQLKEITAFLDNEELVERIKRLKVTRAATNPYFSPKPYLKKRSRHLTRNELPKEGFTKDPLLPFKRISVLKPEAGATIALALSGEARWESVESSPEAYSYALWTMLSQRRDKNRSIEDLIPAIKKCTYLDFDQLYTFFMNKEIPDALITCFSGVNEVKAKNMYV
ncbi:MAG: hypothetical protein ACRDF4_08120, partial [Rhabdochlamydiaceae bacterium]